MAAESGNINDLHKYQSRPMHTESEESDLFCTSPHEVPSRSSFGKSPLSGNTLDSSQKSFLGRQDSGVNRKLTPLALDKINLSGASDDCINENVTDSSSINLCKLRFNPEHDIKGDRKPKTKSNTVRNKRSDSITTEEAELGTFGELPVYPARFSKNRRHTLANVR